MYRLMISLADGSVYSFDVARMPRHWKSWLMHQLPYGMHSTQGATFSARRVSS